MDFISHWRQRGRIWSPGSTKEVVTEGLNDYKQAFKKKLKLELSSNCLIWFPEGLNDYKQGFKRKLKLELYQPSHVLKPKVMLF